MTTLVISDLHLSAEHPELTERFARFCEEQASEARQLYILGDLFEVWLGDDHIFPEYRPVIRALHALSEAGVEVRVMHGNRDFLLGAEFERQTGARLIADPSLVEIEGTPVLLLHGDTLCTEDVAYQQMRNQLRNLAFINDFLRKPVAERLALARALRERSESAKQEKAAYIMDVNAEAVTQLLRRHGVATLVHGHTHRPGVHQLQVDGRPARRYVLGTWEVQPNVLVCSGGEWRLTNLN